jgi:hypothetical protein
MTALALTITPLEQRSFYLDLIEPVLALDLDAGPKKLLGLSKQMHPGAMG